MASRTPLLHSAKLSPEMVAKFSGGDAAANVEAIKTIPDLAQRLVVKEAFAGSIRNMWVFYTCVGAIAVGASFFIERKSLSREVHVETKTGLESMGEKGEKEGIELRGVA
jgi:hypothetical protein